MHELSVTENILSIAETHAKRANARKVTDLFLTIGQLSSIVDDSVQFYWDIISAETICSGSILHFNRVPARLACEDCPTEYPIEGDLSPCPNCGSSRIKVLSGDEFFLESISVEQEFEPENA